LQRVFSKIKKNGKEKNKGKEEDKDKDKDKDKEEGKEEKEKIILPPSSQRRGGSLFYEDIY